MIILFSTLLFRVYYIEYAETELKQLGTELQEKREGVEQLETELTEKSAALSETSSALADNQTLLKESADKVAQIKNVDSIETGKTVFGGKVTVTRDDYDKLTNLAKKQIAAEREDGALHQQIDELTQENKTLKDETTSLKKEIQTLRPFRFELSKVQNEFRELKEKHLRVLEFIKSLGLVEKLRAFLNLRARGQHR